MEVDMKFKPDETVVLKEWDELEATYGSPDGEIINVPFGLTKEMYKDLSDQELKISSINEDGVIHVTGFPQYNISQEMIKYVGEESNYFVKWDIKDDVSKYPKASEFGDLYEEQCQLTGFDTMENPIIPRYMWDNMKYLFLPQEFAKEYYESDAYAKCIHGAYGLVAYGSDKINSDEELKDFLSQETGGYHSMFVVIGDMKEEWIPVLESLNYCAAVFEEKQPFYAEEDHTMQVYYRDKKSIVVFSNMGGNQIVRSLYSIAAIIFGAHVTEDLMRGIIEKNQTAIYKAVEDIYATNEKLEKRIKFEQQMENLKDFYKKNERQAAERRVSQLANREREVMSSLRDIQANLREARLRILGLDQSDYDENLQMFLEQIEMYEDKIVELKVEGSQIFCQMVVPLAYWSDDEWNMVKCNLPGNSRGAALYKAIFEAKTYTLMFEQGFAITYNNEGRCGIDRWNGTTLTKGIPNPHMADYNCWGDNQALIVDALSKYDLTMAFAQIVSALSGINVSDSAVFSKLGEKYFYQERYFDIPCLKNNETGELITMNQFFAKSCI